MGTVADPIAIVVPGFSRSWMDLIFVELAGTAITSLLAANVTGFDTRPLA